VCTWSMDRSVSRSEEINQGDGAAEFMLLSMRSGAAVCSADTARSGAEVPFVGRREAGAESSGQRGMGKDESPRAQAMKDMTDELLKLYAQRQRRAGIYFRPIRSG